MVKLLEMWNLLLLKKRLLEPSLQLHLNLTTDFPQLCRVPQEIVTGHVDEVWALATHPQQQQFLSAGYDQHIHLWDTLTHRAVWSSNLGDQAQSACFNASGDVIVVGMASGKWMALDSATREVYGVHSDGHEPIQVVRFSPDDRFLALGSRDGVVYVYQVAEGSRRFNRMGRCMVRQEFST